MADLGPKLSLADFFNNETLHDIVLVNPVNNASYKYLSFPIPYRLDLTK